MIKPFLILAACLLASEGFRYWWFNLGHNPWKEEPVLAVRLFEQEDRPDLEIMPVEGNIDTGPLRFDHAEFCRIIPNRGPLLTVFHMAYDSGNPSVYWDAFSHPPENCMGASGWIRLDPVPDRTVQIGDQTLDFRRIKFRDPSRGTPLYIHKAAWFPPEARLDRENVRRNARAYRFSTMKNRAPHPPASVLLVGLYGVESEERAWQIFERELASQLYLRPPGDRVEE